MNDLASTDQIEDDDDDEREDDLVPLSDVLRDLEDRRLRGICRAAVEISATALRAHLAASGGELRLCRLCHADIAVFSGFGGKPRIVSVVTGGDHVEMCTGLTDDQRARLRTKA